MAEIRLTDEESRLADEVLAEHDPTKDLVFEKILELLRPDVASAIRTAAVEYVRAHIQGSFLFLAVVEAMHFDTPVVEYPEALRVQETVDQHVNNADGLAEAVLDACPEWAEVEALVGSARDVGRGQLHEIVTNCGYAASKAIPAMASWAATAEQSSAIVQERARQLAKVDLDARGLAPAEA
ncbi:MAG: hypothetical protein GEU73_16805 [Chloroflexi bacterium]|nr:hypothetical protein [Chloroflexota bacterium]